MEKPKSMQSCNLPQLDKEAWMINLNIIKHHSYSHGSSSPRLQYLLPLPFPLQLYLCYVTMFPPEKIDFVVHSNYWWHRRARPRKYVTNCIRMMNIFLSNPNFIRLASTHPEQYHLANTNYGMHFWSPLAITKWLKVISNHSYMISGLLNSVISL